GCQRQQTAAGREGGQQDRSQTLQSGLNDDFLKTPIAAGFAQIVEGVDQNNIVVHDDAGQRHDAHASEYDAESLAGDQQAQEHPGGGQYYRGQNQQGLIVAVELGDHDDRHQHQRDHEGLQEEGEGCCLFLVGAPEAVVHSCCQGIAVEPLTDLLKLGVHHHAGSRVGPHINHLGPIDALYGVYLGFGFSGNETTDGYGAVRSGNADGVDLFQAAVLLRIADADVHLFLRVIGPVVAHENAIGQQLHGAAHFRDAGAEHGGASAVDGDLPLNARNRGSIVDIDESGHFIGYVVADPARLRDQCVQIF